MLERDVQKKTREYAHRQGWRTYKWSGVNCRGVPDCIFVRRGVVIFIEFKRPGGKPSALQQRKIHDLRGQGCRVFVVDSVEVGRLVVDLYTNKIVTGDTQPCMT